MKPLFFSMFIMAVLCSCSKKDNKPQLPPATSSGANTFGCLIDGEVFTASGHGSMADPNGVALYPIVNTGWLVRGISGRKSVVLRFDFSSNPTVPRTFTLGNTEFSCGHYYFYSDGTVPSGSTEWHTMLENSGTVTVTARTTTFASGTFEFNAQNGNGDVVHVTEGRFDIAFD